MPEQISCEFPLDFVAQKYSSLTTVLFWPVSITIFVVVWSVQNLTPIDAQRNQSPLYMVVNENSASSPGQKLADSTLNALVWVAIIAAMTFLMVILYKYNCIKVLVVWLIFAAAVIFFFMSWMWMDLVFTRYQIPYDLVTIGFIVWNFGIVGLISIFYWAHEIFAQGYLVVLSFIMGWVLTRLPEWTTWTLLIGVAIYDIVAVLCPKGPLRLLLQEAQKKKDPIPGFIYDSAGGSHDAGLLQEEAPKTNPLVRKKLHDQLTKLYAKHNPTKVKEVDTVLENYNGKENLLIEHIGKKYSVDLNDPGWLDTPVTYKEPEKKEVPKKQKDAEEEDEEDEDPFLVAEHATPFKLGLGDFIFYSLLVGRAAKYSYVSWMTCYVTVLMGLLGTLTSLLFFRGKIPALPALPISILLGTSMYFLSRFVVAPYLYGVTSTL